MTAPSRRDRFRPLELIGLSGVVAVFVGIVVLMSSREVVVSLIFLGLAFIVTLVVLAMLALATKPTGDEQIDLDEQNRGTGH